MDDRDYIDGLLGIHELNNISLLREAYIDAYVTSAENYRRCGAEVETPEKAALAYREFVREAVRSSVLDWKAFEPEHVMAMAAKADIPQDDREQVVTYVGRQFRGLHEGNVIRYRLRPEDLEGVDRE